MIIQSSPPHSSIFFTYLNSSSKFLTSSSNLKFNLNLELPFPVSDATNLVFAGSTVASGQGVAVIYATGTHTEFGQVPHLTTNVKREPSTLGVQISKVVHVITIVAVGIGVLVFLLTKLLVGMGSRKGHPTRSHQWYCLGHSTEAALLVAAIKAGFGLEKLNHQAPRVHEVPFDSHRRMMTVLLELNSEFLTLNSKEQDTNQNILLFTKGAPYCGCF